MTTGQSLDFPPFQLDLENERLCRGIATIPLRPKTFAVLRYLAEHPGQLVSREELVQAIWGSTKVSEGVPRGCLHEIRLALQDSVAAPQFIETVPRRGWRFIGPVERPASGVPRQNPEPHPPTPCTLHPAPYLVGREAELARLRQYWEKAANGERQLVFVTGEPGIGKTTLLDAFVASLVTDPHIWLAHGQCVEHYGAGEAYMPVLAALEHLGRTVGGEPFTELLRRYAPMWLVQMPALSDPAERAELQQQLAGTTRERMLREIATLLEMLAANALLVFVLEDLHWSDQATVELLAYLARRREGARLLVIGTYRPTEVGTNDQPLRNMVSELQAHRRCVELPLMALGEAAIAEYLAKRFPHSALPLRLAEVLHERTGGNPLFLMTIVEDLISEGFLAQVNGIWGLQLPLVDLPTGVPSSLRQLLARQMERVHPTAQQLLEAGSLAGTEFSAAAVAAVVETDVAAVEECCERLTEQQQFIRRAGISEWPDGTVAARYGFHHALYQQLWHERVPPTRRQQWHRRIGERLEGAYGKRTGEIAAELAVHFEQGRESQRAIQYHKQAAEIAARRYAYQEAVAHCTTAIELLKTLPDTPEHAQQELALLVTLGVPLLTTKGYAAPEVEKTYSRARELCRSLGDTPQHFTILLGLQTFYHVRGQFETARALGEELLAIAHRVQNSLFFLHAHRALGVTLFWIGELIAGRMHLERSLALYNPEQYRSVGSAYGIDPGMVGLFYLSRVLWLLGYPDQAWRKNEEALTLAREIALPDSVAFALSSAGWFHLTCRDTQSTQERADTLITLSHERGFSLWEAYGAILRGWVLTEQQKEEGIAQIRQGLAAFQATGAEGGLSLWMALLAEAYGNIRQYEEGLDVLAEALVLVERSGGRHWEAELYRLKGELTLEKFGVRSSEFGVPSTQHLTPSTQAEAEAEACLQKAVEIAQKQQAKSLELRAATSLARLWQRQDKNEEARQMLAEIYGWFTEGFDTADLKEAKALLDELTSPKQVSGKSKTSYLKTSC